MYICIYIYVHIYIYIHCFSNSAIKLFEYAGAHTVLIKYPTIVNNSLG